MTPMSDSIVALEDVHGRNPVVEAVHEGCLEQLLLPRWQSELPRFGRPRFRFRRIADFAHAAQRQARIGRGAEIRRGLGTRSRPQAARSSGRRAWARAEPWEESSGAPPPMAATCMSRCRTSIFAWRASRAAMTGITKWIPPKAAASSRCASITASASGRRRRPVAATAGRAAPRNRPP